MNKIFKCLSTKEQIIKYLQKYNIKGKTIKDIRMIGMSYNFTQDNIEEIVYNKLEKKGLDAKKLQYLSTFENIDKNMMFSCEIETDEPLLLKFDNDDVLSVECCDNYYFSYNKLPWDQQCSVNINNIEINKIFDMCINQKIVDIEMITSTLEIGKKEAPYNTGHFYDKKYVGQEVITEIILWLSNSIGISLSTTNIDFFYIKIIDNKYNVLECDFKKITNSLIR